MSAALPRQAYFLATLAEECSELAQVASKSLRFDEYLTPSRRLRLIEELSDLLVAAEALGIEPDRARMAAKLELHLGEVKS